MNKGWEQEGQSGGELAECGEIPERSGHITRSGQEILFLDLVTIIRTGLGCVMN